jgi:hypothetical protein
MQIVMQGCPVEEIHRYNIMASYFHDMAGIPDCKDQAAMERYFANGKPIVGTVDSSATTRLGMGVSMLP